MPVLPDRSLVFAFPARLFVCLRSPHGALLEMAVVHRIFFALLWCSPPFPAVVNALFCSWCAWWKNNLYFTHILRSADCCLHSLMSSLKITVCARRVIPFKIVIVSDIVWPTALANSLPFSNCSISWHRGSERLYGSIVLTDFSLRYIPLIALYL